MSLNDLVVELASILDSEAINRIEKDVFVQNQASEWGISREYVSTRVQNKAAEVAIGEIEENAFRYSGKFNKYDKEAIERMMDVGRNENVYDKKWYQVDKESLHEFLEDVNMHDERISMLELWVTRKQAEIDSRFKIPTESDMISDKKFFNIVDEKFEQGRHQLIQ